LLVGAGDRSIREDAEHGSRDGRHHRREAGRRQEVVETGNDCRRSLDEDTLRAGRIEVEGRTEGDGEAGRSMTLRRQPRFEVGQLVLDDDGGLALDGHHRLGRDEAASGRVSLEDVLQLFFLGSQGSDLLLQLVLLAFPHLDLGHERDREVLASLAAPRRRELVPFSPKKESLALVGRKVVVVVLHVALPLLLLGRNRLIRRRVVVVAAAAAVAVVAASDAAVSRLHSFLGFWFVFFVVFVDFLLLGLFRRVFLNFEVVGRDGLVLDWRNDGGGAAAVEVALVLQRYCLLWLLL